MEADDGYAGEINYIDLPHQETNGSREVRRKKQLVRSRHETANIRFKNWGILWDTYRYDREKNGDIFRAVVVITQLEIENGHPLFQVVY